MNYSGKHIFFCICLFLIHPLICPASPYPTFTIQQLDNRNGLSNSAINTIYSDSHNLLWIATWDGLNMYDGSSFHVFNYSHETNSKSIGSNVIKQVIEDNQHNIWASTIEGISRYDSQSGNFYNYFYQSQANAKISEQEYLIALDKTQSVYCFNNQIGFCHYDHTQDKFLKCSINLRNAKIVKFSFNALNELYILYNDGVLSIYSGTEGGFTQIFSLQNHYSINNYFISNNTTFFSTSTNELYVLKNKIPSLITGIPPSLSISSIIFYQNHYLLASSAKGLSVIDVAFQPSDFLENELPAMQNIHITAWANSSEDILWVGTDGNGLLKIYPSTKLFGTVNISDNNSVYNKAIRSFCNEDNNLWVATKGSGIISLQNFLSGNQSSYNKISFTYPVSVDNSAVYALKNAADGFIYIGTDAKGIGIYDKTSKHFYKWNQVEGFDKSPEFGSVYSILPDEDGSLWIGTSGYGLIHLSIKRDNMKKPYVDFCKQYVFTNSDSGPANDIIYSLTSYSKTMLWVGCRYGGLSLLDKTTMKFKTFKAFSYEGSLTNNDVLSLFTDKQNRTWIGTSYGLNWINNSDVLTDKPVFHKLTVDNGLPNNTIHSIEQDNEGNIWISTNNGLAKLNHQNLQVLYYKQIDGLQSNEFCDGAAWKDSSGYLFFGGVNGFNHFKPADIKESSWMPNLLIYDISIGEKKANNNFYTLSPSSNNSLQFNISRANNYFECDIKAISFLNAEKCEYAYKLDGYDKNWHYIGTNGKIIYENISPGNYTLLVKWTNGEGTWTKETAFFTLEVKQYWWLSWYAYTLYALAFAIGLYYFYRYRKNRLEINHQLELEHITRVNEKEMHQNRMGLFTNIAHELQTPLTLIMGSAERLLQKNSKEMEIKSKPYFLSSIHQQASRLTYLVHQLLEFRKLESGFVHNQYSYLNISMLLTTLAEPFITLSGQNKKRYSINIQADMMGWVDKDKLEIIVFNLLSNAFKHSPSNEEVNFSALQTSKNELEITVSNTGVSLDEESLNLLFNKFYTTGSSNGTFGTGIGLAFTKQLVEMMEGKIEVNNYDQCIYFKIILPPGKEQHSETSGSNKPSYLYSAVTNYNMQMPELITKEANKQAIVQDLAENGKPKILITEDEPEIRFLLKDILKNDYLVFEAENGETALQMLETINPDIIICDVLMPNMGGLEFCNIIKNSPKYCHLPVIMLSALDSDNHQLNGYDAGADAYIGKPFHTDYLLQRIKKLLEYRHKLVTFFKTNKEKPGNLAELELTHTDKEFLKQLVQVIEENIDNEELNAAHLEKTFCYSKMQLYRKIKALTDMTPGEFIKHIRLKKAAQLLKSTNLTVTEIFYQTGFNNQSYFFREFKKYFNCAPNEYRNQYADGSIT